MLGLINELSINSSLLGIAGVSFLIGIISSAHCLGMCGAIVFVSARSYIEKISYQFGRLLSYVLLAFLINSFSSKLFFWVQKSFYFELIAILLGSIFVIKGLLSFRLFISFRHKVKKLLSKLINTRLISGMIYQKLFSKVTKIFKRSDLILFSYAKSFAFGSISILLPCSTLYFFLISVMGLFSFEVALVALFSFWIPTSLVLIFGVDSFQSILRRFNMIGGATYILLGVAAITYRAHIWKNLEVFCQ